MPIPLGVLAVAGAGGAALPSYELIQSVTSGYFQNIDFTNLQTQSSNYRHLQLRGVVRATGGDGTLSMKINEASSGYAYHWLGRSEYNANVNSSGAGSVLSINLGTMPQTADIFASFVIDILDAFSTSKNKTVRVSWGSTTGASDPRAIYIMSGLYNSTSAITSINFNSGNNPVLATGTRISLYGIRG